MSSTICKDQDQFNKSFHKAVKYTAKKNEPKTWVTIVLIGLWLLFAIWAIMLAMRVPNARGKTMHIFLSILASPIYILSFYLDKTG